MLKTGFQPCSIAYKNWNPNVKPLSVEGPLIYPISPPVLAWEIGDVCVQALPQCSSDCPQDRRCSVEL